MTAWRDLIVSTALEAAELGGTTRRFGPCPARATRRPEKSSRARVEPPVQTSSRPATHRATARQAPSVAIEETTRPDAVCRLTCAEDDECGDGEVCQAIGGSDVSVCLAPESGSADESGCSVGAGSRRCEVERCLDLVGSGRRFRRRKADETDEGFEAEPRGIEPLTSALRNAARWC